MKLEQGLAELRKLEKKKFDQSIDLLVSLKGIDAKKDSISMIVNIPNKIKDKKICGFFSKNSNLVKTITNLDFPKYKDKKVLKKLVKEYDFFISEAKLMPAVATTFGKALGPTGKMPSPQLGIVPNADDEKTIKATLDKINNSVKIRIKEASIKLCVGKESMEDNKIIQNIKEIYNGIVSALPVKRDNIRKVMIKLTMSKPIVVEMN